jgi:anti-anti-sigma regulatory factor
MSVVLEDGVIQLRGECPVGDAEPLLALLQADAKRLVDLSEVVTLHTAVVQVLLALRPTVRGSARDAFLHRWIEPLFVRPRSG